MLKVKFLQDFQGRETREVFYLGGETAVLENSIAQRLIDSGFAVLTDDYQDEMSQPDLEPTPKKRGHK